METTEMSRQQADAHEVRTLLRDRCQLLLKWSWEGGPTCAEDSGS